MLNRLFGFDARTMNVRTEVIAGATTFLTMSYVLAVNPTILATTGMDKPALFTSTALAVTLATMLMALMAKLPFAQAPSMGLNAFFAFLNIRELILDSIPANLRYAISAGIGMFIAFIGLKNAHIIVSDPNTFVALGHFTPAAILGVVSILLSGVLMAKNTKGALLIAIIATTLLSILMGVTKVPEGWLPVSAPHSIEPIFCQFDFSALFSLDMAVVISSLLFVNIFDTVGTLLGLADKTGIIRPDGSIPHVREAMLSDAIGTSAGALLGSSTITTYVESAAGVAEGGRSGLTSAVTALLFLLALFLSPLFLLIPAPATSGALVMVGVLMLDSVKKIEFTDITETFPAFITMITMVLCYSIADGICLGLLSYVAMKCCTFKLKDVNLTLIILAVIFVLKFVLG